MTPVSMLLTGRVAHWWCNDCKERGVVSLSAYAETLLDRIPAKTMLRQGSAQNHRERSPACANDFSVVLVEGEGLKQMVTVARERA